MKKFDRLCLAAVIACVLSGVLLFQFERKETVKQDQAYKVEQYRLAAEYGERLAAGAGGENNSPALTVKPSGGRYITDIMYCSIAELEREENAALFWKNANGKHTAVYPLYHENKLVGLLRFDYRTTSVTPAWFWLAEAAILLLLCLFLGIWWFVRQKILKPFQELSRLPEELSKGHLKGRLPESKNRYFGRFLWGISMLQEHLEYHRKQEFKLQKEKKLLILSLSHDIKTPLNMIELYAKALKEGLYTSEEERKQAAAKIELHAGEIGRFTEDMKKALREELFVLEVRPGDFYLKSLMSKLEQAYCEQCRLRHIRLEFAGYENKLLKGDLDRAFEACENIMENALKYGDGRRIRIDFQEEEYCLLIRFYNTGNQVEANEFSHLFDTFFRGRTAEGKEGNGLGLAICRAIMHKSGGDLFAEPAEGGMCFVLVFSLA